MLALAAISATTTAVAAAHPVATPPKPPLSASHGLIQIGGLDLDLTQLLFIGLAGLLALAAIAFAVMAVGWGARRPKAPVATGVVDTRGLAFRRGASRVAVDAQQIAAAEGREGVLLGSGAKADVSLDGLGLEDTRLRLTREGGLLYLTNLGAAGAVAVSDVPLRPNRPWPLHAGQRVRMGGAEFTVEID